MKQVFEEQIKIPEGIECTNHAGKIECKKSGKSFSMAYNKHGSEASIREGHIVISHKRANKKNIKIIKSYIAHIKNVFRGLEENFVYRLEICNVHFPMTVKVEGEKLVISNFLGEKTSRFSKILSGVNVEIKGKDIIVSGHDIEKTGQTAANMEKATKVREKDRRIFQDGIFITEKSGRAE